MPQECVKLDAGGHVGHMGEILPVYGYYGTQQVAAARILEEGFQASENKYDWLGGGVYFWQDAPTRAWRWAEEHHRDTAAVVQATIHLDDCMDLLDMPAWTESLRQAYDAVQNTYERAGEKLRDQVVGRAHWLDCAVVNLAVKLLARQGMMIRVVRGAFREGVEIYPTSAFFTKTHVQISVIDRGLIREPQRLAPKEEIDT